MATHPDALTCGDSRCPPVLLRLTHVLRDAAHPAVRPGRARCGTTVTNLRQRRPEGRIGGTCDARSRVATCARCGRTDTRIAARRGEGGICGPCYRVDPQVVEQCARCGRLRTPAVRRPDGGALCNRCRTPPVHHRVSCGEVKPAALLDENRAVCHLCHNRHRRSRRLRGRCGRLARIARNATGDHLLRPRGTTPRPVLPMHARSRGHGALADRSALPELLHRNRGFPGALRPLPNVSATDRPRHRRRGRLRAPRRS